MYITDRQQQGALQRVYTDRLLSFGQSSANNTQAAPGDVLGNDVYGIGALLKINTTPILSTWNENGTIKKNKTKKHTSSRRVD